MRGKEERKWKSYKLAYLIFILDDAYWKWKRRWNFAIVV